jgi:hypothetical protein
MALINKSRIPTKKLEKLIEFCRPKSLNLDNTDIIVKNCKTFWSCDFHYGNYAIPYVILRFDYNKKHYPLEFSLRSDKKLRTGYHGEYSFSDFWSMAVFTTRHELAHIQQYNDPIKRQQLYHNLKICEQWADKVAFKKLKEYKKLKDNGIDPLK